MSLSRACQESAEVVLDDISSPCAGVVSQSGCLNRILVVGLLKVYSAGSLVPPGVEESQVGHPGVSETRRND